MDEDKKKEKKPLKEKLADAWATTKEVAVKVYECARDNKEVAIALIGAIGSVGYEGIKLHGRRNIRKQDKKERKTRIYDPHTGQTHYLRRPMKPKEEAEFNRRIKAIRNGSGETYYDILSDMGLLE